MFSHYEIYVVVIIYIEDETDFAIYFVIFFGVGTFRNFMKIFFSINIGKEIAKKFCIAD